MFIEVPRLRVMNGLPRFVEPLQGKTVVGERAIQIHSIRCKAYGLPRDLCVFLILPLFGQHYAQTVVRVGFPWVAVSPLLIYLGCFIQLPSYSVIVGARDPQLFAAASVFTQLE